MPTIHHLETDAVADGAAADRPLAGIRIVDAVHGPLAPVTRYLAELGALVDRIKDAAASDPIADLAANGGKRCHALAVTDPAVSALIARADVVIADSDQALDLAALREGRPALVTMRVSDFGGNTRFSDWAATDPVLHALSGELSRSGIRGRAPLLPPGDLAYQCAASQAAYALVVSLYRALRTGVGDHLDFSALDGAVQALDPGYGISGSATMGKPAGMLSRGRPASGFQYPILRCADGHVRICLLARRQWLGMFRWMGEPAQFASPEFEKTVVRYKSPDLLPAIGAFFAGRSRAALEEEGQRFGVPISAVLTLEEAIDTPHFRAREAMAGFRLPDGRTVMMPNGVVTIDGVRMIRRDGEEMPPAHFPAAAQEEGIGRPFEGLRVLDLGVIVVGAEQGRLLADQGADVVKIETRAFPDGNRQSYLSYGMSVSFAAGHRNKRSMGLNLRDPAGRALFLDMAAKADVILSNFKPGTLEGLGLGHDAISAINPAIVMADSSAFGATGPWSGRMGYGPLVRAATGLTRAWCYPDDPEGFSDSITIYPDHVAARIGAMAVVALLIRRLRTGRGGTASVAQAEVMLNHFARGAARVSSGQVAEASPDWPWSVYPAAGDDEWCVVTVRGDADWHALCAAIGFDGGALDTPARRLAARGRIDAAIGAWMAGQDADAAMTLLQRQGVPAARMLRLADLPAFPYFRERAFYRVEGHPYLNEDVIAERSHVTGLAVPDAPLAPAPLMGEHSATIAAEWLGLDAAAIGALVDSGAIEPIDPQTLSAANAGRRNAGVP